MKAGVKISGQPLPHESSRGHVTGDALYTDDLLRRFPNLLHAWPVLAPHAHALVALLDPAAALAQAGVATVLTASDVPGGGDTGANRHDEPRFPREGMYHHQPVARALADSIDAARRGAAHVRVQNEPLPAILAIEDAMADGSFHTAEHRISSGDMSIVEASALRLNGELQIGGQEHFYLETQATLAWIDKSGFVSLH